MMDHPIMPNETFILNGKFATAVASVYLPGDLGDVHGEMLGLMLYQKPPFFGLIIADEKKVRWIGDRHMNIVPAVREYGEMGGEY